MKRLIIINILLIIALNILPKEMKVEAKEENRTVVNSTEQLSSRSSEPRQDHFVADNKTITNEEPVPTEISQRGIDFIKQCESCITTATRLIGEKYLTIGYRTLWSRR